MQTVRYRRTYCRLQDSAKRLPRMKVAGVENTVEKRVGEALFICVILESAVVLRRISKNLPRVVCGT